MPLAKAVWTDPAFPPTARHRSTPMGLISKLSMYARNASLPLGSYTTNLTTNEIPPEINQEPPPNVQVECVSERGVCPQRA